MNQGIKISQNCSQCSQLLVRTENKKKSIKSMKYDKCSQCSQCSQYKYNILDWCITRTYMVIIIILISKTGNTENIGNILYIYLILLRKNYNLLFSPHFYTGNTENSWQGEIKDA